MSTVTITAPFNPDTGEKALIPIFPKELLIGHLRKAIELMNNGGKHWVKGSFFRPIGDGGSVGYCAVGAIATSVGWGGNGGENEPLLNALSSELLITLGEEPRITWTLNKESYSYRPVVDPSAIFRFNDAHERTWVEVKSLFESTIERLERADD